MDKMHKYSQKISPKKNYNQKRPKIQGKNHPKGSYTNILAASLMFQVRILKRKS